MGGRLLAMLTVLGVVARVVRTSAENDGGAIEAEIMLMKTPLNSKNGRDFKISRWGEARGTIRGVRGRLMEEPFFFVGLTMLLWVRRSNGIRSLCAARRPVHQRRRDAMAVEQTETGSRGMGYR